MRTDGLIRALVAEARPVRRLPSPERRAFTWLLLSAAYGAFIVFMIGLRPDIQTKLTDVPFALETGAAFLTGLSAAVAAFCAGVPGRPLWERSVPLAPLAVWLASLGEGCWRSWVRLGAAGLDMQPDLICFPSILLVSVVPGALILWMIRRGAPITPVAATALATLAAAALGAAALRLFHTQDASVMVLVWQFGSVAVLTGLGALGGRQLLRWPERQAA
ncbi:MAG: NrsF family protein [Hyphomicrobiaceae bacterium]